MLAGMDSVEVAQWNASMKLDPDESDRADIRHALLMDNLTHLMTPRRKGQGRKLPSVRDYLASLPWRDEEDTTASARPKTQAELQAKVNAVMALFGGKTNGR
jgi:hypothetical protein